jgi:hypothetical protein
MRQQVSEPHECFPPSGRFGQSTIESCVDHQVLAKSTGNRPQIADGVALLEWLREMPYLPRNCELPPRMGDGQCLSELRSTYIALNLLGKYPVRIEVKSVQIFTEKNRG